MSKHALVTCFYCSEIGHTSNWCYVRNYGVPKGKYKWVPKGTPQATKIKGPKFNWVPASSL